MSESRGAKSIHRALDVLSALGANSSGLTLAELSRQLDLPKSTVHRILTALLERQFIRVSPQQGEYRLGYEILRLSQACLESLDLVREARPRLEELNRELDETVLLGVLDELGRQIIYLDKLDTSKTVRLSSRVGRAAPAHCTALGKATLSCFEETELRQMLAEYEFTRFTDQTITDLEVFLEELNEIRERGYAVDLQEYRPNVACVAAPIRSHTGKPLAAVSVSAPSQRVSPQRQEQIGLMLVEAVKDISNLLRYMQL